MRWLDPMDCLAARGLLERGNALEAARVLLQSPHKDHRAAREILLQISKKLVDQAGEAHQRGGVLDAWNMVECAARCAELDPKAAALRRQIADQLEELKKRQDWVSERLRQAEAWAKQGRVRSAIDLLLPLGGEGDAERLRLDLERQMARFQPYLHECREHLARGNLTAARKRLKMAQAIHADDPEVVPLDKELRQAELSKSPPPGQAAPSRPLTQRSMRFALDDHALVVSEQEIVIGNPLGESVPVPIQGRLHRRHVLLLRDRGQYAANPHDDQFSDVRYHVEEAACRLCRAELEEASSRSR